MLEYRNTRKGKTPNSKIYSLLLYVLNLRIDMYISIHCVLLIFSGYPVITVLAPILICRDPKCKENAAISHVIVSNRCFI